MRLSYTSLSTYENCPAKFKFQYIDKAPGKPAPALSFGDSLHQALYHFHNRPIPIAPKIEELHELLDAVWNAEGYRDEGEEASYLEHGHQVLEQYYADNADQFQVPVALEHRFSLDLDGVRFNGVIDRMDRLPGGGYEIIDYKTNRRLPPQQRIDEDLQLSVYSLAAQEIWGITPERLTLYFLLPGQRMSTTRTQHDADALREKIATTAARIEAEKFEPRENPLCDWCDFQHLCPIFRQRYEEDGAIDQDARMGEIVDEWVAVKRRIRQDYRRLDELVPVINAFCDEHNYRRLFSQDGAAIDRQVQHVTQPDDATLREILEPRGLFDQIVSVDPKRLQALIETGSLPPDVEDAVLGAREEARTQYALWLREPRRSKRSPI